MHAYVHKHIFTYVHEYICTYVVPCFVDCGSDMAHLACHGVARFGHRFEDLLCTSVVVI